MLAGISVEYYTRLERGNATGVSEDCWRESPAPLQLDEAEHAHLFDLVRTANMTRPARRPAQERVRPSVQRILDAMTEVPAYVRNARLDILSANRLGYASTPRCFTNPSAPQHGPAFLFLNQRAVTFFGTGRESPTTR